MGGSDLAADARAWEQLVVWALVAYACIVAAILSRPRSWAPLSWLAELRGRWRPKALTLEEAARERRIRDECRRRRVERARLFLVISNVATLFHGPIVVTGISLNRVSLTQSSVLIAMMFCRSTAALFSRRLTSRAVDAFFCFYVLLTVSCELSPERSTERIAQERAVTLVTLLYWSVAALNPWLNGLGFLCAATADTIVLVRAGDPSRALGGWGVYSVGFAGILGLDSILRKGVRMEMMASDSENELDAIKTLLDGICDVVVQLDARLCLRQHSPKLADILMIQVPGRSLEGEDLRGYMAAEHDGAVFTSCLASSREASAHAQVFHAKMRDSSGSTIDMEFFSVGFKGRDGDRHHILGMREFTDVRPVLPPQSSQPAQLMPRHPPAQVVGAPRDASPPLMPPPPVHQASPREPPERLERRGSRGTPAVLRQSDIGSRSSSSAGAASSASHGDLVFVGAQSSASQAHILIETTGAAMRATVDHLLASWVLRAPAGACCQKHAALFLLQSVVSDMRSAACVTDFGAISEWQCPRCGIRDARYKYRRHRTKCFLCKDVGNSDLQGGSRRGDSAATLGRRLPQLRPA